MRFVIFDDESLEPITVLNLPLTERDALERRFWRVPVPEPFDFSGAIEDARAHSTMQVVDIEFEPFCRRKNGREQRSVFAFTSATALAMLLNPAWLPGQRGAVDYLQKENDALTKMLMRVYFG